MKGNTFLNTGFSSTSDLVAYLTGGIVLKKLGVKKGFVFSFAFAIFGSLLIIFISAKSASQVGFASFVFISKFGVSCAYLIIYAITGDYFPPAFSGAVFGFCNLVAKIVTFLAPEMAEVPNPWPMLVFCVAAILAGVASLFLKSL